MMKVTYMDPEGKDSIKCDVATRQAEWMSLFLRHSVMNKESGITHAGVELLLADKIRTYAAREGTKHSKGATDILDIRFCMTTMLVHDKKMNEELKSLYTQDDLDTVLRDLEANNPEGESWDEIAVALDLTLTPGQ